MRELLQLNRQSKGAVLVEFTIVLPLFLIVIVFVLELGMLFIQDNTLNKSVRESVRYLSKQMGFQNACNTNIATEVIDANMDNLFPSAFADFGGADSYSIETLCVNESTGASGTPTSISLTDPTSCQTVTYCTAPSALYVRVGADFQPTLLSPGLMGFNLSSGATLSASYMMRVFKQSP
jgi:Flp pilus assembly protein TadG